MLTTMTTSLKKILLVSGQRYVAIVGVVEPVSASHRPGNLGCAMAALYT
jgi:hypothetical protein